MDNDLESKTRNELIAEIRKLRAGIRKHRDSSGHELCWYQPQLWSLLPDEGQVSPDVPAWPQFLKGCIKYRQSLDEQCPQGQRTNDEYGE